MERGGYSAAARHLGVTPAAVSRAVARQEQALDVRLVQRTTRKMTLTPAGQLYYEQCRRALALLEEADRSVTLQRAQPRGPVRISAPTTYGHYRLVPILAEFAARHPDVSLEVDFSNDNVDLVGQRYDLAIRRGVLADSSLIVRKLEDAPVGVYASPDYLARHGRPERPDELTHRTCIPFVLPSTGRVIPWGFVDSDGRPFDLEPANRLRCSGDVLACLALARHGAGLVQAYSFLAEDDVRSGRLVEVLERFSGRSSPFSLVRPARRGESLAVKTLADAITDHCAAPAPPQE